jgi:hypothetical protein
VSYYHQDRIHDSLEKDTPNRRPVEHKLSPNTVPISNARLVGLYYPYSWREGAKHLSVSSPKSNVAPHCGFDPACGQVLPTAPLSGPSMLPVALGSHGLRVHLTKLSAPE